jgi:hypothetical protein
VDPDPANVGAIRQVNINHFEAPHPHSSGSAHVNMMINDGTERVGASYRNN